MMRRRGNEITSHSNIGLHKNDVEFDDHAPADEVVQGDHGRKDGGQWALQKKSKKMRLHLSARNAFRILGCLMTFICAVYFCFLSYTLNTRNSSLLALAPPPRQQEMVQRPRSWKRDENVKNRGPKFAVYLQMGTNFRLFNEMTQCLRNVAQGLPDNESLDIHVALLTNNAEQDQQFVLELLSKLPNVQSVNVILTDNVGADIGQFLTQLKQTQTSSSSSTIPSYEAILKVHAKSDDQWRQRMLESLCGNPHQVTSILSQMQLQTDIDLVAALGTAFSPETPVTSIYPRILEIYNMDSPEPAFDKIIVQNMNKLYTELGFSGNMKHVTIVAGSCFWIRWSALQVPKWVSLYDSIYKRLTLSNMGLERVIERLIPSMLIGSIAEITPAPRIFALYFPQYHAFPENDRFWGANFTEWTLLKPYEPKEGDPPIRKPLSVDEGGLGYYNLLNFETRKRQADLAKQYGVTGFTYYHYWFSGSHAPDNHLVMTGLFDKLLEDGEPNIPFFFSWANEPWNRRWNGQNDGEVLLSQEYGDEEEWKEHFTYLLQFFQHPNYEKVNGRPW